MIVYDVPSAGLLIRTDVHWELHNRVWDSPVWIGIGLGWNRLDCKNFVVLGLASALLASTGLVVSRTGGLCTGSRRRG